jgi:predicted transcriptional regulator
MEISFDPEVKATLERIAKETGRGPEQVVVDLVSTQLDYDAWFRREVLKGIDSLDRGEYIDDEEVDARLDQILKS